MRRRHHHRSLMMMMAIRRRTRSNNGGGRWRVGGVLGTGDYFILLPRICWCVVRGVSFARAFPPREASSFKEYFSIWSDARDLRHILDTGTGFWAFVPHPSSRPCPCPWPFVILLPLHSRLSAPPPSLSRSLPSFFHPALLNFP